MEMAENHSKSKLKRKKPSVEGGQAEISFRGTLNRSHATVSSADITAEPVRRSVVPAAVWWNREQLPAVESLWALTLKSALPYLESQHCHLVPDLPHRSPSSSTALKLDEQRWCDLSEEVAPLPEPSPPSPRTSPGPDPLRHSSPQRDLSVQTKPVPDPPDRQLSSHSRQGPNGKITSLHALTERPQPSLHSREGAASSAGPSSVGRKEGRKVGEQGKLETGPLNKQLLKNQMKVSDGRISLQRKSENKEKVEDKEEEEVHRSVRGDGEAAGAGGLQSCPMCLLVFPAGFTQMDCDGHLAQCLSEVNVDMTW